MTEVLKIRYSEKCLFYFIMWDCEVKKNWVNTAYVFIAQVVKEGITNVKWPKRNDVIITSIMVVVLAGLSSIFLFSVDQVVLKGLKWVLHEPSLLPLPKDTPHDT